MTVRIWSPDPSLLHTLERPGNSHFCQIHQKESSLVDAVIRYLVAGVAAGENLMLVTRANRRKLILEWLAAKGVDVDRLVQNRQLFLYASNEMLATLMNNGQVDQETFLETVPQIIDEANWSGRRRLRIYGDAVSDLWKAGNHAAAVELESLWGGLCETVDAPLSLFCGYLIDALDPHSYSEHLALLGREHSLMIPAPEDHALRCVLDEAVRDIFGAPLAELATRSGTDASDWRGRLPLVFRIGLWLHEEHPAAASRVLKKAREICLRDAGSTA